METFCNILVQVFFWALVAAGAGLAGLGIWGVIEGVLVWKDKRELKQAREKFEEK